MPPSSRRGIKRGAERVTPYSTNQRRLAGEQMSNLVGIFFTVTIQL